MSAALLALVLCAGPFADLSQGVKSAPPELPIKGKPLAAARWTDKLGLNVVVLTSTAVATTQRGDSQQMFGYHFVRAGQTWKQLWKVQDHVLDCEFDLTLEVKPASLSITDLDKDGTAETAFAYELSCGSDVSPNDLKVILHEGEQKYALRGRTRVQTGETDDGTPSYDGGDRKPDAARAKENDRLGHANKLFDGSGGK